MNKESLTAAGGLLAGAMKGGEPGKIESRTVMVGADEFDYQVFIPAQISSFEKPPVIIFLHGIGQRGSGGFVPTNGAGGALARHYFSQVPAIVLLPQCRQGSFWSDAQMDEMAMKSLAQTVEEFGADERRIYLTGVSMGGYGVWHFAARYPGKFAALVSLCGGSSLTKGDRFTPLAEKVGKTPAWLFHGADDKVVEVSESRQIVAALEANCGNVRYSEYPKVGHNVWLNVVTEPDLISWLLAQKLG